MINEDIEKILQEMPECGHKVIVMQGWHKLLRILRMPEPFINNVDLMQALAEFTLSFLTAVGFSVGVQASKDDTDPTLKLVLVSSSIFVIIPFIFNILLKIKKSGRDNIFHVFAASTAQIASTFALTGVFVSGLKLVGTAQSLGVNDQIKNCLLVSMAGVYSGHYTGLLTHEIMMRTRQLLSSTPVSRTSSGASLLHTEITTLEKIKKTLQGYASTMELQFLIAFFVVMIININQSAADALKERGLSDPFVQNVIIFPVTSLLANIIAYCYNKLMGCI